MPAAKSAGVGADERVLALHEIEALGTDRAS